MVAKGRVMGSTDCVVIGDVVFVNDDDDDVFIVGIDLLDRVLGVLDIVVLLASAVLAAIEEIEVEAALVLVENV